MKKLISKYNQEDALLVISTYPKKGQVYTAGMGGVASYTKNNLVPLAKRGQKIVVLADKEEDDFSYEEDGILIIRCWRRGSWGLFASILSWIKEFSKVKNVMVQFEFALYDGLFKTLFFPIFLLLLRLSGKRVFLVLHQVIYDLNDLWGHLGWRRGSIFSFVFSKGITLFYLILAAFSNKVVVLESVFAERLVAIGVDKEKIKVIPHGVDNSFKEVSKAGARRILGIRKDEKVVLLFGFLTWYKGSDALVKGFSDFVKKHPQTKIRLILAGGESQTQKGKKHYRRFVESLYKRANLCNKIKITGYVPEDKIPLYFSASDLLVFPYRTLMSSSGPLSLAFSFETPFAVSYSLSYIFDTFDLKLALKESGLKKSDLVFNSFANLSKFEKTRRLAKVVKRIRNYEELSSLWVDMLGELEVKEIFAPSFDVIK